MADAKITGQVPKASFGKMLEQWEGQLTKYQVRKILKDMNEKDPVGVRDRVKEIVAQPLGQTPFANLGRLIKARKHAK